MISRSRFFTSSGAVERMSTWTVARASGSDCSTASAEGPSNRLRREYRPS